MESQDSQNSAADKRLSSQDSVTNTQSVDSLLGTKTYWNLNVSRSEVHTSHFVLSVKHTSTIIKFKLTLVIIGTVHNFLAYLECIFFCPCVEQEWSRSVPETERLDTSAHKAKGLLAQKAKRQPPSRNKLKESMTVASCPTQVSQ